MNCQIRLFNLSLSFEKGSDLLKFLSNRSVLVYMYGCQIDVLKDDTNGELDNFFKGFRAENEDE